VKTIKKGEPCVRPFSCPPFFLIHSFFLIHPFEQLDFAHFSAPSLNEQKPAGLSGLQTEMVGYLSVR